MKIWLDDLREKPDNSYYRTYNYNDFEELIKMVVRCNINLTHISFDHDLGEEDAKTGYDCAKMIEELAYHGKLPRLTWNIHSANPSGKANIEKAMKQANIYWSNNENG